MGGVNGTDVSIWDSFHLVPSVTETAFLFCIPRPFVICSRVKMAMLDIFLPFSSCLLKKKYEILFNQG